MKTTRGYKLILTMRITNDHNTKRPLVNYFLKIVTNNANWVYLAYKVVNFDIKKNPTSFWKCL